MLYRIPRCYVKDNYVQVTNYFNKNITIIGTDFENDGILCHYDFNSDDQNINTYLNNERRQYFPYSNIPIYKELRGNFYDGFYKVKCINQIFEFNKHYINITDNHCIKDLYFVKDEDEAIMYEKAISVPESVCERETTRKELEDKYKRNVIACISRGGQYIDLKKKFSVFFNQMGGLLVLKDEEGIKFRVVEIVVRGRYLFIREYDIPFNEYKVEELKYFNNKINYIKKPIIFSFINDNIDKKEITKSKRLVKQLNNRKYN